MQARVKDAARRSVSLRARWMSAGPVHLHETRIPTFKFQDSLPKLAVPKLEDSLEKYLYFSKPMVTPEEHAETEKLVRAFEEEEGQSLQEELVEMDKKEYTSFYNKMWFDMYLTSRDPLPLNFNPQLTFNDETVASKNEQAVRATNLIQSSLRFYRTLLDEKLKPDIFHTQPKKSETTLYETACMAAPRPVAFYMSYLFGAYPLDMSQYKNLFSSTRIPGKGKDGLRKFGPNESKHIMVQRGTACYTLQVLDDALNPLPRDAIERGLRAILQDKPADEPAVGLLSSMNRDDWAAARETMVSNATNKASLEAIDSALFAVCLDDESPESYQEIAGCMLHGTARNRWFDKSFQLIVAANGKSCVNFEHAWGDGVAVLRYFNEVYEDSTAAPATEPVKDGLPSVAAGANAGPAGVPCRLGFELDASTRAAIDKAGKDFDAVIKTLEVGTFETEAFGKSELKKFKIGGDGFMQMGFQLAHERLKGFTPATYESASTAAFKHGRTETIRSATPEAAAFAKGMCDASLSREAKEGLLRTAVSRHGEITKDCLMGKGMDRHLFALRVLAERRNANAMPAIFTDKTYQVLNHIILSTSTLQSPALFAGGFGPVNKDCYGLAYGISDHGARTAVASYQLGSDDFASALEESYKEMLQVLAK